MTDDNKVLSRGQKQKSMLDQLLILWELDYKGFCEILKIDYKNLWRYRQGLREFRLNMEQIAELDKLLKKVDKRYSDLPLDWYLDPNQKEQHDENTTDQTNSYSDQAR
ncbi:hypothetical protein [Gloeothece verrucosa]|uniref:Uncharacterized protein n=1 Tax=Gloeothece verrucosa (strain PCC 7822) TaxID=497965 RepID=E0U7U9_GLOV7|nr:hypothetical protein [Gloeothece verrucosa]ADN16036.1 hypothetical protein Cyan7822_4116 [Gloeothece verrucosa PCC 7822]